MEPKEAGVPVVDTPKAAAYWLQAYSRLFGVQILGRRRSTKRRCASCDTPVTNRNLGGHSRKLALSGDLWCYSCADEASAIFQVIASLSNCY